MLRDVAPTMNKVSHRMGAVQGGHEGNIPVEGQCATPDSIGYLGNRDLVGLRGNWWDW